MRLVGPEAAALVLVLVLAGSSAFAQAPGRAPATVPLQAQAPAEGESTVVEELEVVAHPPGPAMWRVTRGQSQVVIVGGYSPLPHALAWNDIRLERALDGAQGFYEPKATINPLELAGLFFDPGAMKNPGGRRLSEVIGPERQARLERVAAIAHADVGRMQPFKPAVAGILAYQTFLRAAGLSAEKPATTIRRLARGKHVPDRPLAKLGAASLIRSIQRMDQAQQLTCFDAVLTQIEWESGHATAAATAWSNGDLKALKAERSKAILAGCLAEGGGGRAILDKGVTDSAASIDELLSRPGRNVALIDMDFLTARNGVLDRLKAGGAEISIPAQ